jgi:hypothetical protein
MGIFLVSNTLGSSFRRSVKNAEENITPTGPVYGVPVVFLAGFRFIQE